MDYKTEELGTVIEAERKLIKEKRRLLNQENHGDDNKGDYFGIALSGGGIRSATFNLGILHVLSACGVLSFADYISTVSGGGYIGGYIHAKARSCNCPDQAPVLFPQDEIDHLKEYGHYLAPGKGLKEKINKMRLSGVFVFSTAMNWIWAISLFASLFFLIKGFVQAKSGSYWTNGGCLVLKISAVVLLVHFFLHSLFRFKHRLSGVLYYLEGFSLACLILFGLSTAFSADTGEWPAWKTIFAFSGTLLSLDIGKLTTWEWFSTSSAILLIAGFFADPNAITLHRFYRDRLAEAYLSKTREDFGKLKLSKLRGCSKYENFCCAPYPLINCCLNLLGEKDPKFKGTSTSDYFLLSPLYCGSKRTGYVETTSPGYRKMTLSTAVAISGAAVNPGMGTSSSRVKSLFMTLLNLRLGFWARNPEKINSWLGSVPWWPIYHIKELCSKTDTTRYQVNISDGGHIENLAVYELLRRHCGLIVAVDAGADPKYGFSDLNNLVIRARHELGLEIKFRQEPEKWIRPLPSSGFSKSHFVVADISELPREKADSIPYKGLLVYVKASLRPQNTYKVLDKDDRSFHYKIYHPSFPHESTINQFFDPDQWRAYYQLGRFVAGDLLKINVLKDNLVKGHHTADQLYRMFDAIKGEHELEDHYKFYTV